MTEMLDEFALPTGMVARVVRRELFYFVTLGPRANATVLSPDDAYVDALKRVCRLLSGRVMS